MKYLEYKLPNGKIILAEKDSDAAKTLDVMVDRGTAQVVTEPQLYLSGADLDNIINDISDIRDDLDDQSNNITANTAAIAAAAVVVAGIESDQQEQDTAIDLLNKYKAHVNRFDDLSNQTVVLANYLTLNAQTVIEAPHKISWSYDWSYNTTNTDFEAVVTINGQQIARHRQEPKDSAGTGGVSSTTTGGVANTGTDQRAPAGGFVIMDLPFGQQEIKIDFRGTSLNQEATIYRGCIMIEEL